MKLIRVIRLISRKDIKAIGERRPAIERRRTVGKKLTGERKLIREVEIISIGEGDQRRRKETYK
jgi:hypothetical protein